MTFSHSRPLGGLLALCAGLAFAPPSARALPPEYLSNAAFHPTDPNLLVVRYESALGGLLISRDGGKSFRVLPSQAFNKYGLTGHAALQVGNDGKILLGVSDGLFVDDGKGCGMALPSADFADLWIAAIAPHPSDADVHYFVTTGDTKGKHAGVWKRDKAGALSPLGKSEPITAGMSGLIVQGFAVIARAASTEGVRFIETGTRQTYTQGQAVPTTAPVVRYSDDLGATWTERPVPDPDKTQGVVRLLAAEAGEPMKLVVALEVNVGATDMPDQVLVSTDGAQSFTPYSKELLAAGQALLLPGGALLLGDSGSPGGLWKAEAIGKPLTKISSESTKCLVAQPKTGKVFACRGYEVGMLDVATGNFCGVFQINETLGLVSCTPDLAQNKDVENQLCNAWCGPAHYAFSPLCGIYTPETLKTPRTCGIAARTYDNSDPDPSKRWIEPPGEFAAARCAGFERMMPAVDAGVADAGASGGDAGESDAGASADAGATTQDAGSASGGSPDGGSADAGGKPPKDGDGDSCSVGFGAVSRGASAWGILGLLAVLVARRRRQRR